jgi:hypothetical protein
MVFGYNWHNGSLVACSSIFIFHSISYNFNLAINPDAQKMVKKIKQNISIEHNPITTICGFICFFYSLILIGLPLVYETFAQIDIYYSIGIGIVGLCLLIVPDDLKKALTNLVKKKSE